MELEGTYLNGSIVPDAGFAELQEGERVRITRAVAEQPPSEPAPPKKGWFMDLIRDLIVDNPDSPGDLAMQHEHYRLGTPKR